ncbi:unnamed protein product [Gadus morhua 'NCC']
MECDSLANRIREMENFEKEIKCFALIDRLQKKNKKLELDRELTELADQIPEMKNEIQEQRMEYYTVTTGQPRWLPLSALAATGRAGCHLPAALAATGSGRLTD